MEKIEKILEALREEYRPKGDDQELLVRQMADDFRTGQIRLFLESCRDLRKLQQQTREVKIDWIENKPKKEKRLLEMPTNRHIH